MEHHDPRILDTMPPKEKIEQYMEQIRNNASATFDDNVIDVQPKPVAPKKPFTDRAVAWLRGVERFTRAVESLVINNVSALAPWLTPLIPAYMVGVSMYENLAFPVVIAVIAAIIIEIVGLSAVYTTYEFWDFNSSKHTGMNSAPLGVALPTAVFYLVVVLLFNVLMDMHSTDVQKIAKGLISSLSAVSAIILALRAGHSRRLLELEAQKEQRKEALALARAAKKEKHAHSQVTETYYPTGDNYQKVTESYQHVDWRNLSKSQKESIAERSSELTTKALANEYHISERTALNWLNNAKKMKNK